MKGIAQSGKLGNRSAPTRFPPEPNGHLHVGHAKSICLNLGIAQESRAAAVEQASALRTVYRSTTA